MSFLKFLFNILPCVHFKDNEHLNQNKKMKKDESRKPNSPRGVPPLFFPFGNILPFTLYNFKMRNLNFKDTRMMIYLTPSPCVTHVSTVFFTPSLMMIIFIQPLWAFRVIKRTRPVTRHVKRYRRRSDIGSHSSSLVLKQLTCTNYEYSNHTVPFWSSNSSHAQVL